MRFMTSMLTYMSFILIVFLIPISSMANTSNEAAICLLDEHPGISDSDAMTSAELICDEVRKQGVSIGRPVTSVDSAQSVYRVKLRKLGEAILLSLVYESPLGQQQDQRNLQLKNIEEIPIASQRIAEALVQNRSLEGTAEVNNLVGQETRVYAKKHGEFLKGIGLGGYFVPRHDIFASPMIDLHTGYESIRWGIGTDLRFGGFDNGGFGDGKFGHISWSMGGKYFFLPSDISPYAGGGLQLAYLHIENVTFDAEQDTYDSFEAGQGGLGSYLEAGVEFLRLHQTRFAVDLRLDIPFFSLKDDRDNEKYYAAPLTIGLLYSW